MPVQYFEVTRLFCLTTATTAYLFQISPNEQPLHLYWGAKLPRIEDYPLAPPDRQHSSFNATLHQNMSEYLCRNSIAEYEPALCVTFTDGTRDIRLKYLSHRIEGESLSVKLADIYYKLELALEYRVIPECDMLTRRVTVYNAGQEPFTLEQVLSACLPLAPDRGEYRLTHLAGTWACETLLERSTITPGRKVLEGRLNYSGHAANPFFALDLVDSAGQGAGESIGEVYFGALQWSGNWKIVVEQERAAGKRTRVASGINDFEFSWRLGASESFETPWLALGYSDAGFGKMSRNLHRYVSEQLLPPQFAHELRPVLYNSWEAVFFEVNEAAQIALAEKAAKLGAEVFVVDDGWFGERHSDHAALGDWQPNPVKFPNGLKPLIAKVNELGMDFGLWVEPEMVNPDSDLYRAHPEWAYHYPNREPITGRNQLILNLCREDVQLWMLGWLDALLSEHNIRYVKWDYNRAISEMGWVEGAQGEIPVRHVQALYRIMAHLRAKHPQVLFEACSGGGGRADMGMLAHFDHVWTSDNTDPLDRLLIQQGYSLVYPPKTMYCWVTATDWNRGNYPIRYRFHSSFMGALGIGTDLNSMSEQDLAEAAALVAQYKQLRPVIQQGNFYRLTPLGEEEVLAYQYQREGEGVILAFGQRYHFWKFLNRLRLYGLEAEALYQLEGDLMEGEPQLLSGEALMRRGLVPKLERALNSALITLHKL
jgi:alpha-galactosidase